MSVQSDFLQCRPLARVHGTFRMCVIRNISALLGFSSRSMARFRCRLPGTGG